MMDSVIWGSGDFCLLPVMVSDVVLILFYFYICLDIFVLYYTFVCFTCAFVHFIYIYLLVPQVVV